MIYCVCLLMLIFIPLNIFLMAINCVVSFLYTILYTLKIIYCRNLFPALEINDHTLEIFMKIFVVDSVIS
jgi:hypothetical protein